MREAGAPSTGELREGCNRALRSVVPAPPGVVMVAPPEVPRNAEGAQIEGRAKEYQESAAKGSIEARARKPRPGATFVRLVVALAAFHPV